MSEAEQRLEAAIKALGDASGDVARHYARFERTTDRALARVERLSFSGLVVGAAMVGSFALGAWLF